MDTLIMIQESSCVFPQLC